jgi:hypothetical protein
VRKGKLCFIFKFKDRYVCSASLNRCVLLVMREEGLKSDVIFKKSKGAIENGGEYV